jgi:hypothetical protein
MSISPNSSGKPSRNSSTADASTTTDDWTRLREAVKKLERIDRVVTLVDFDAIETVQVLVPKLLDAYAELWEMSMAMTQAWEKLNESKNSLYVPDATEMVQGAHLNHDGTSPSKRSS